MQKLLILGAVVDHVDANMASALMLAASTGPLAVVKVLVEHGADVNLQVRDTCWGVLTRVFRHSEGLFCGFPLRSGEPYACNATALGRVSWMFAGRMLAPLRCWRCALRRSTR